MIPFWLFNDGAPVEERIRYLRACRKGGIRALAMHCRSGNLIPYASDTWYSTLKTLVAEAARLDMKLWLYDEDPFPSGAAGGQVMAQRKDLKAMQLVRCVPPPGLATGQLWEISEQPVVWAGLVPLERPLQTRDLTPSVGTIRRDWFVTPWDSRHYYPATPAFPCVRGDAIRQVYALRVPPVPPGYGLMAILRQLCGVEGSWGSLPDCLHPDTFPTFQELSLAPYRRWMGGEFGRTIPGIFTDEAKPHGFWPVTAGMFGLFRQAKGFDLTPRLYQLFGEPLSNEYVETRLALREWVAGRFLDVFMAPYRDWCDANGLCLVGHMSPEDDPVAEAGCLGSVMPLMKKLHCPGTDLIAPFVGNRATPAVNLGSLRAGSIRAQTRAAAAVAETFGLFDWDTTTAKCHQVAAWHKVLGIDRFFVHGFFQSVEGVVAHEAPPDYGPKTPIFAGMVELNRWTTGVEAILDGARDRVGVAVLNSLSSYWDLAPGMDTSPHEKLRDALWQTLLACLRTQVGIHLADEADVAKAGVSSHTLRVGACRYHTLLIPALTRMPRKAFETIAQAAAMGVKVFWFGGGPGQIVEPGGQVRARPVLPGCVEAMMQPSEAWCRANMVPSVRVRGAGSGECYVRRFRRRRGTDEWLLAVNVSETALQLSLAGEGKSRWVPEQLDGVVKPEGSTSVWRVPAGGNGLFRLEHGHRGRMPDGASAPTLPRLPTGANRVFRRLEVNRVRLDRPEIQCDGVTTRVWDSPRPYWQIGGNYHAERMISQFVGDVPVLSRAAGSTLNYGFTFEVAGAIDVPVLVCDPRCARGAFTVFFNGHPLGGVRRFPRDSTRPLRLALTGCGPGKNRVELRFQTRSAMDGLLAQLFLEGDFNVDQRRAGVTLSPPLPRDSRLGWQRAGLPHYMGGGVYEWGHRFSADEAGEEWAIEIDQVVDSAELYLNGRSLGRRAWAPWCWTLKGLKAGGNAFELRVHGTGGNLRKLNYPNQPQGWIGHAWLTKTVMAGRGCG